MLEADLYSPVHDYLELRFRDRLRPLYGEMRAITAITAAAGSAGSPEADLKKMLKGFALATDEQIKGVKTKPKKTGFVDLLWEGARRKLAERSAR